MEIKKLFTSAGITGVKEIFFKNLSPTSGINLIYFTPNTYISFDKNSICGRNFITSGKIKTYFNVFIIPPSFSFYNHRVSVIKYSKFFKGITKEGVSGRIVKKVMTNKTELLQKSNFYDLTVLNEAFMQLVEVSEIKAVKELISLFDQIVSEFSKSYYKKDSYVLIELDYNTESILDILLKYSRINGYLFENTSLKGVIVKTYGLYFPLTIEQLTLTTRNLTINTQVFNKIKKHIEESYINENKDKYEKNEKQQFKKDIRKNNQALENKIDIKSDIKTTQIKENLKKIKELDNIIKDDKTSLEINNLLNKTNELLNVGNEPSDIADNIKKLEKNKEFEKYKKEIEKLKKLNYKFNGSIDVQEAVLPKKLYFDPIKAVGIKTFTGYNKQQTEFDEVLDESMLDLFNSLEIDKDAGIKVQNIKIDFEDNIKNRFKVYKIKLKNTEFGYEKPYTITLKVPYPAQGKYIKLDSNNYIMINQLFPYPILKVQPNIVRIYTHYSTAAVELKGSNLNSNDLTSIKDKFLLKLADSSKNKNKIKIKNSDLHLDDIDKIKNTYNLPSMINDKLFTNIEITT